MLPVSASAGSASRLASTTGVDTAMAIGLAGAADGDTDWSPAAGSGRLFIIFFLARHFWIFPRSLNRSTGLVSKSEHPTSTLLSRSVASAWAVSAMIGIFAVFGLALIRRVASHPSIAPRATSIKIRSGTSVAAMVTPLGPSAAPRTRKPRRSSRRVSISRLASLSSTNKILVDRPELGTAEMSVTNAPKRPFLEFATERTSLYLKAS
jgi:hypothetical protein